MAFEQTVCRNAECKTADAYITCKRPVFFLQDSCKTPPNKPKRGMYLELEAACRKTSVRFDPGRAASALPRVIRPVV